MVVTPEWLPELECFEDYNGDWPNYLAAIYEIFCNDFVHSSPTFQGRKLKLKRHPIAHGKEATFWHLTSSGESEADREPDLRRCERIRWPRPVIENDTDPNLKVWSEKRRGEDRIHIWFEAEGYLVVLAKRKDYILPWTAFYVEHKHQRTKFTKRWKKNS
ncbi:MAG: hypothetical protein CMF22_04715 [Idiomarinaceae bacterium]|nr:hypothetical protein [Idiomarinaceae bacterium]